MNNEDNRRYGFICLWRSLTNGWRLSPVVTSEPACKGFAWIDLLTLARHKSGMVNQIKLNPGDILTSKVKLAQRWNRDRKWVIRMLKNLEKNGEVTQQTTTHYTLISICNWEDYQFTPERVVQIMTQPVGQPVGQPVSRPAHTYNNVNKEIKKKEEEEIFLSFEEKEKARKKKYLLFLEKEKEKERRTSPDGMTFEERKKRDEILRAKMEAGRERQMQKEGLKH